MQNGVSYTPGQLLAVVASRTVLVVDAPTDWSLAGPLWELALDDAPVDEILDVLVRRGIRTSPSFAIVRVEGEAVRALVRGTVPVCFERTGEPVRLDATGATTWLEGLISGATRVLVGGIEQRTELPYLVDTGVVLVAGLALPTVPGRELPGTGTTTGSTTGSTAPDQVPDRRDGGNSNDSGPGVPAGPVVPVPVGTNAERAERSGQPVDARAERAEERSPRVVDLTRSASRTGSNAVLGGTVAGASVGAMFAPVTPVQSFAPPSAPSVESPSRPEPDEIESAEAGPDEFTDPDAPTDLGEPADRDAPAPATPNLASNPFAPFEDAGDDLPAEPAALVEPGQAGVEEPAEPVAEHESPEPAELLAETPAGEPPVEREPLPEPPAGASFLSPTGRGAYAPPPWSLSGGAAAAWGVPELSEHAEPSGPSRSDHAFADLSFVEQPPAGRDDLDRSTPEQVSPAPAPADADLAAADPPRTHPDDAPERSGYRFEPSPLGTSGPDTSALRPTLQPPVPSGPARPDRLDQAGSGLVGDPQVDGDDLLVNGSARGPLPTALPNFDPPSVSLDLQHLRGRGANPINPINPVNPVKANPVNGANAWGRPDQPEWLHDSGGPGGRDSRDDENTVVTESAPAASRSADERVEESFEDYVRSRSREVPDDEPAALPFRVRGQSLRPEHQIPFGGLRSNNGSWPRADRGQDAAAGSGDQPDQVDGFFDTGDENPFIPKPALNGVNGHAPGSPQQSGPEAPGPVPNDEPESEGLLLPAFFRGARAARSKTTDPVVPDHPAPVWARGNPGSNGNVPGDRPRRGPLGLRGPGTGGPVQNPGGPGVPGVGPQGREPRASVFTPPGGAPPPQAPPREPPRLLGVWCDAGHVTSPDQPECRVCGLRVPPQAPILVARPPLGVLIFDNGDRVEVDRPVVLGRDPKPVPSPDPESPVLHAVQSQTGQVSRTHAEIRASGWDVVLTDLDAMNGTTVTSPGGTPVAVEPGVPTVIPAGSRADLGGETGFVFEVED